LIRFIGTVEGVEVLNRAFNRVEEKISDFRFIWPSVAQEFYSIQREQFESEGAHGLAGKWRPLTPAYKKWKEAHHPGMPILQATTLLYQSMTSPDAPDSIFRPEVNQLTLGTKREGARAHQRTRPIISMTESDKRRIQKAIQLPLVQFVRRQGFEVMENVA
jgi:hypothetical protein